MVKTLSWIRRCLGRTQTPIPCPAELVGVGFRESCVTVGVLHRPGPCPGIAEIDSRVSKGAKKRLSHLCT